MLEGSHIWPPNPLFCPALFVSSFSSVWLLYFFRLTYDLYFFFDFFDLAVRLHNCISHFSYTTGFYYFIGFGL